MPTQLLTPLAPSFAAQLAAATHPLLDVLRRRVGDHVDLGGWALSRRDADWRKCVAQADVVDAPGGVLTVWPSCAGAGRWSVEALLDDGSIWCRYGVAEAELAATVDEAAGIVSEAAGVAV